MSFPSTRASGRRRRRRCFVAAVGLLVLMVFVVSGSTTAKGDSSGRALTGKSQGAAKKTPSATVKTTRTVDGTARFQVGYDYTQKSHLPSDAGGNPAAVTSAEQLLRSLGTFQNVALMGWGAGDPEPTPGRYDWASLDSRVDVMAATVPATERMITLCSAPGWMKVGGSSQEWNMDAAVAPAYFADFAELAAQVAERFDGHHKAPDGTTLPKVDYFDVWNSMKGFWDRTTSTWDVEGYTTLYNDVYTAIKRVRPDALVGGPYAPVGAATASAGSLPSPVSGSFGVVDPRALDVVTYWLEHKVGAQFLTVEGGPAATDESGFASGAYFAAVDRWLRGLDDTTYPGATTLPLFWAEFYPGLQSASTEATGAHAVAVDTSNIVDAGLSGARALFLWEMEGTDRGTSPFTGESVWTDTAVAGGGQPTGLFAVLAQLRRAFPPGTTVDATTTTGPVTAWAARHRTLVVSQSSRPLVVDVDGTDIQMAPYAVTVVPT